MDGDVFQWLKMEGCHVRAFDSLIASRFREEEVMRSEYPVHPNVTVRVRCIQFWIESPFFTVLTYTLYFAIFSYMFVRIWISIVFVNLNSLNHTYYLRSICTKSQVGDFFNTSRFYHWGLRGMQATLDQWICGNWGRFVYPKSLKKSQVVVWDSGTSYTVDLDVKFPLVSYFVWWTSG